MFGWSSVINNLGAVGQWVGRGLQRAVDIGRDILKKSSPYIETARKVSSVLSHAPIPVVRDVAFAVDKGLGLIDAAVGRLSPLMDSIQGVGVVLEDISTQESTQLE